MASDEAQVKMTADDREAMAMWNRQLQAVDRLARAYENMGQRGAQASRSTGRELENVMLKIVSLDRGIGMITSGLQQMADRVRQFDEKRAGATVSRAETFSKFVVQSGLNAIPNPAEQARATAAAKQAINKAAIDAAVSPQQADQAATQLVSSGFSREMVLGGGLGSFLNTIKASGAAGKETDPSELAKATALFMSATGQEMNRQNFDSSLLAIHQMRKSGNLEFDHMQRFSAEAGTLKEMGRLDPLKQLSIFTGLLFKMEDRLAATGFRATVKELATAGASPVQAGALRKIGLTPGDVDMVPDAPGQSEGLIEVMAKIREGLNTIPEKDRASTMAQIFGADAMKAVVHMLKEEFAGVVANLEKSATDRGARERDIITATENAAAKLQRAETREQIALDTPVGERRKLIGEELEAVLAERVKRGEISEGQAELTKTRFETLKGFGLSPERAAGMASSSSAISYFNFGDRGARRAARTAIERAGGNQSILGANPHGPESNLSNEELQRQIDAAENPGFFERFSARRRRAAEEAGQRAAEELQRRQPAPNQGASLDTSGLLDQLKQINAGIQQLAAANRAPQRLTIEDANGRARPARKAVESFNNVG